MKIANKVNTETGVTFTFTNGRIVECDITQLPTAMVHALAIHGMRQKGGDCYASANDKGWTIDECADTLLDIYNGLMEGNWSQSGGSGNSMFVEALVKLTGETTEECAKAVSVMTDEQKKLYMKRDDIKAAIADIKSERAKARLEASPTGDTDDLMGLFDK